MGVLETLFLVRSLLQNRPLIYRVGVLSVLHAHLPPTSFSLHGRKYSFPNFLDSRGVPTPCFPSVEIAL
jgi:hypothetical protein